MVSYMPPSVNYTVNYTIANPSPCNNLNNDTSYRSLKKLLGKKWDFFESRNSSEKIEIKAIKK